MSLALGRSSDGMAKSEAPASFVSSFCSSRRTISPDVRRVVLSCIPSMAISSMMTFRRRSCSASIPNAIRLNSTALRMGASGLATCSRRSSMPSGISETSAVSNSTFAPTSLLPAASMPRFTSPSITRNQIARPIPTTTTNAIRPGQRIRTAPTERIISFSYRMAQQSTSRAGPPVRIRPVHLEEPRGGQRLHHTPLFDLGQNALPVLPDRPIEDEDRRHKHGQRHEQAAHHDGIVEPLDPPERGVVERGPEAFQGWSHQHRETQPMKQRVQEIGHSGEKRGAEQEGGQVDPQQQHDQQREQIVQAPERGEPHDQ